MALSTTALLSLEETRDALKQKGQFDTDDVIRMINALTLVFEKQTGRLLKQRTLTDYRVDGSGDRSIVLPWIPVQSVSRVDIRNCDDSVNVVITDSTKWKLDKKSGILELFENLFVEGDRNVLVTMSVGYADADIELDELKNLLVMQLIIDWRRIKNNEVGIASRSMADGNVTFSGGWGMSPPRRLLKEVEDGLVAFRDERL